MEKKDPPFSYPLPFGIHSSPDSHHSNSRHVTAQVSHSHYGNQCPHSPGYYGDFVTWFPLPKLITCGSPTSPSLHEDKTEAWVRGVHIKRVLFVTMATNPHHLVTHPPVAMATEEISHSDIRLYSQGNESHPGGENPIPINYSFADCPKFSCALGFPLSIYVYL